MVGSAVVVGHICLDIIPAFSPMRRSLRETMMPGALIDVGAPALSTGGAVSNTGLALHRLGIPTRLMGKVGDDHFGHIVLQKLRSVDPALAQGMIINSSAVTSYTLILSPPATDRVFLHCPGANDTFCSNDLGGASLAAADLFHFGYPPLMRCMFEHEGRELARVLQQAREADCTVTLDLARPDPASPAGQADWAAILARVLPLVDVFTPSVDELLYMFDRAAFAAYEIALARGEPCGGLKICDLQALCGRMIQWGAAAVLLKLGSGGAWLQVTDDPVRLMRTGRALCRCASSWLGFHGHAPCYCTDVVGTTGAGDCTIAGLLAALLREQPAGVALQTAVAVGACSVEVADATSGVHGWDETQARLTSGWGSRPALPCAAER